ncbi:efflux RND transporter periplasmic adaptor subunit [Pontiella agarivorans]|uniref:Efflux RND transporter periplasmic adaptor subunit n=1 Tax=Pontiella agarivorans TaxID=3038953 RepID=A0ABU5MW59_9BACT|nr:efflux RND transporter periplasmic adaptor subunit [Pontiella agarivorans]MDZ8118352.1 efflux RND transporter periplasmic adaptor subunit [Pontiella agarivorans]
MNNASRRTLSILIGLVFIIGGLLIARYFMTNKPEAQRRRAMSSMVPVVETVSMKTAAHIHTVECLGTVTAEKSADLRPEVSGRIIAVNPGLVEGGLVKQGDVLVEIDDADYRLALAEAEAALLTAQSNYRIEEGQQDVVRHEMEMMGTDESDAYSDLMLREPQLKSAEAAIKTAELAVESAKLDLERTKIHAPFDAVVVSETADVGDYAQSSSTLIELAAIDRFFVYSSIPFSSLTPLPEIGSKTYPAELTLSDGTTRLAQTYKLLPTLTDTGRMARILLTADQPYTTGDRPMLINEYVRIRINGDSIPDSMMIPRKYLRDGNVVWTIDSENKLRILQAEVIDGYADEMLIRIDGPAEIEIVTTELSAAVEGMQLRRDGEPMPESPQRTGKPEGKPAK